MISLQRPALVVRLVRGSCRGRSAGRGCRAGRPASAPGRSRARRRRASAVRMPGPAATNVACMLTLWARSTRFGQVAVLAEELARTRSAGPASPRRTGTAAGATTTTSPLRFGCSESLPSTLRSSSFFMILQDDLLARVGRVGQVLERGDDLVADRLVVAAGTRRRDRAGQVDVDLRGAAGPAGLGRLVRRRGAAVASAAPALWRPASDSTLPALTAYHCGAKPWSDAGEGGRVRRPSATRPSASLASASW